MDMNILKVALDKISGRKHLWVVFVESAQCTGPHELVWLQSQKYTKGLETLDEARAVARDLLRLRKYDLVIAKGDEDWLNTWAKIEAERKELRPTGANDHVNEFTIFARDYTCTWDCVRISPYVETGKCAFPFLQSSKKKALLREMKAWDRQFPNYALDSVLYSKVYESNSMSRVCSVEEFVRSSPDSIDASEEECTEDSLSDTSTISSLTFSITGENGSETDITPLTTPGRTPATSKGDLNAIFASLRESSVPAKAARKKIARQSMFYIPGDAF